MKDCKQFKPWQALVEGLAHPLCRASVIVPARNEEASIANTLNALACQVDSHRRPVDPLSFEVIVLMNNCTDRSVEQAKQWYAHHPEMVLYIIERQLQGESAHVGTARRWLMDTAWHRLSRGRSSPASASGILSTDSDTIVQPDWIEENLSALDKGADAVGGVIALKEGELQMLPDGARRAYQEDRTFQRLVAQLEDLIDPQEGDPWPRHLEHFGASLACTPEAYAKAGGLPAIQPLEDVAFVDRLRRHGARIRHAPSVVVRTSARFDGRAKVGLSFQLREWQRLSERDEEHRAPTARWLIHRFGMMSEMRQFYKSTAPFGGNMLDFAQQQKFLTARKLSESLEDFLVQIDCDQIIRDTFTFEAEEPIAQVNRDLMVAIDRRISGCRMLQSAPQRSNTSMR